MARSLDSAASEYLAGAGVPVSGPPATFACWVKFDSLPANGAYMWLMCVVDEDATDSLDLFIVNNAGTYMALVNERDGGVDHYALQAFSADTSSWWHLAGVFNETTREVYVGGSGPGTDNGDGGAGVAGLSRTLIGVFEASSAYSNYLDGSIAEPAIYSAALNAAEIGALAHGLPPERVRPEVLVSHWPFQRTDQDLLGVANLTAYNTPTWSDHPPRAIPPFYRRRGYWLVGAVVGDLSIAVSDAVSVSESVSASLPDALTPSVSDSVSVAESVGRVLVSHIAVSDTAAVAEGVGRVLESYVAVSDAVGVAESTAIAQPRGLSVSDAVGVAESVGRVLINHLSVSDAIGVAESVARTLVSHVSVSDSVSAAEAVAARLIAYVNVSDAVGVAESVTLSVITAGALAISVSDNVTLGESDSADVSDPQVSVSDSVAVGESVGVSVVVGYSISVSDAIAVAESVSLALADLSLSVSESVAVAESVGALLASFVSVSEAVGVAESASTAPETRVSVSDSIGVAESTSAAVGTAAVIVSESISVTDSPTVSVAGLVVDRNISVSESLSVSDVAMLAVFLAAGPPGLRVATDLVGSIRAGSSNTPTLRTTKTLK